MKDGETLGREDLQKKIEKAVKNGACCSVNHYVERTLEASL